MAIKIALAGNPNSGKTTLFNALTGSNQYVGNWPGVTVEKKEGKLKKHDDVIITDLPGIYSLSPYTLEEVVARKYLLNEKPDAILNIIDGTNLERNLYLTTQLTEIGIPVVAAINMMDIVNKNGEKLNLDELSRVLGCKVVEISALKGTGIMEAAEAAMKAANGERTLPKHSFSGVVEHALAHIEEYMLHDIDEEKQRWYSIKLFERDAKVIEQLGVDKRQLDHIENDIVAAEKELDDDAESIITNERYNYITSVIEGCYKKRTKNQMTTSDKIDKVLTNRWAALPIFAAIMFIVYYVSVTTVGTLATDWANDGVFGDGWYLFGVGRGAYEDAVEEFGDASNTIDAFLAYAKDKGADVSAVYSAIDAESEEFNSDEAALALTAFAKQFDIRDTAHYVLTDEETLETTEVEYTAADLNTAIEVFTSDEFLCSEPEPSEFGVWISGIPVFVEGVLDAVNCADWLKALILDGIIAGVGSVLGFAPQIFVLFIFLAFLESCGYMARIAFIMDRIFSKFGLSGKSFIPILIGTGCGVPGIMASRTIENERDRRMTIITTTFIPCGAKLPFIAMIAGAIFGGAAWVAPSAYFMGIAAIICSGIILKKTKLFVGDPAPFVMELPAYHMPTLGSVLRSMWERGWSFIKKAGTIILLFSILIWFLSTFGFVDGNFTMLSEDQLNMSILGTVGSVIAIIFKPLGWGSWQAAVAAITGLVAKENIVGTLGVLYGNGDGTVYQAMGEAFTAVSAYSFLAFNLLCAPCFAAMGAIKREMNNTKWFLIAIGYQTSVAYLVAFVVNQIGNAFAGNLNLIGLILAIAVVVFVVYMLFRPCKVSVKNSAKAKPVKKIS